MPYSDGSLRPWLARLLEEDDRTLRRIDTVLDVGAGAGANLDALKPAIPHSRWTALEVFDPYLTRFNLAKRYDEVLVRDVRGAPLPNSDVVIFGDVLEHLERQEAIDVWHSALETGRRLIASLPIVHWEQGESEGNPHEAHLYHWSLEEFLSEMGGIQQYNYTPTIGAFWAEGDL